MEFTRSLFGKAAAVATLALAAVGSAHARDVYWSVGVQAAPGVSVGVANSPPVVVQPAPVYVAPQPVYYTQPQVVYTQPQVVYPVGAYGYAPVVVRPAPVIAVGGGGHGHWKHHHRHWD